MINEVGYDKVAFKKEIVTQRFTCDNYAWTLEDFKVFARHVENGYIVQDDSSTKFIINPEYNDKDYFEEFIYSIKKRHEDDENIHKIMAEEEDIHICGETGREFDTENPVKGCGIKIGEDDDNIMFGNISYCIRCAEKEQEKEDEEEGLKEFVYNDMDNILEKEGLEWSFEKPPAGCAFHTIYISNEDEEDDMVSMVHTSAQRQVNEQIRIRCAGEEEQFKCGSCDIITTKIYTRTYGCMDLSFCEKCYNKEVC